MDQAEGLREIASIKEVLKSNKNNTKHAKVIAITSGKGGVGKTSFAINMAGFLSKKGKKVLIIDADLGLSNVEIMLGVTPTHTMDDLVKNKKNVEDIIVKGPYNIDFISGGNGFFELTDLSKCDLDEMLLKLQLLDDVYDIILIDTGAGISKNVIAFLGIADEIVVIATSEPTSLTDAYSIVKLSLEKNLESKIGIIINRVKEIKEYRKAADILLGTTEKFMDKKIRNLGFIYEDKVVREAIYKKAPFVISYPNGKATSCFKYILEKMTLEKEETKKGIIEKFKNLFKS